MPIKKIEIKFDTVNADFDTNPHNGNNDEAVAQVLERMAAKIREGKHNNVRGVRSAIRRVQDTNGITIGIMNIKLRGKA